MRSKTAASVPSSVENKNWPIKQTTLLLLVTAALAFAGVGCRGVGAAVDAPPTPTAIRPTGSFDFSNHVILLVLENQKYAAIIGNPNAPYLNSLANQYGLASEFLADTHPSIGNYMMLTTGQIVTNNLDFSGNINVNNIARVMGQAGMPWRAYLEALPAVGYTRDGPYPYAKTHNPAYFSDIHAFPAQGANMVPFPQFATDLQNDALPLSVTSRPASSITCMTVPTAWSAAQTM